MSLEECDAWESKFRHVWGAFNFRLDPTIPFRFEDFLLSNYRSPNHAFSKLIHGIECIPQDFDLDMTRSDELRFGHVIQHGTSTYVSLLQ